MEIDIFYVFSPTQYNILSTKVIVAFHLFYRLGYYAQISSCVNISRHHCDLSENITDPLLSHWAKVKAHVGSEESSFVESKEFILANQGKWYCKPKL